MTQTDGREPMRFGDFTVGNRDVLAPEERPVVKGKRRRISRGWWTVVGMILIIGFAAVSIFGLAAGLRDGSSHGFGAVESGQSKTITYSVMGGPCNQGSLRPSAAHGLLAATSWAVWKSNDAWELIVFSSPRAVAPQGTVLARFVARIGATDYCTTDITENSIGVLPWHIVL